MVQYTLKKECPYCGTINYILINITTTMNGKLIHWFEDDPVCEECNTDLEITEKEIEICYICRGVYHG